MFLYSSASDSSHYKVSFPRPSHLRLVVMLTGPTRLALFPTPILVFSPEAFIFQTMEPIQLVAVNLERSAHCSCDDHTFWFAGDHHIVVVQSLSHIWLFATPGTAAHQASLSFTISQSLLKFMSIESMKPSNHLIACRPLLLLPSFFPSIGVFSNELALHIRLSKYWSFSFIISPSNEYSGLIFFRTDWFDLLAVQGTLKSLFQHHSSKASILRLSAFFIVQLSHPYITNENTITLTRDLC